MRALVEALFLHASDSYELRRECTDSSTESLQLLVAEARPPHDANGFRHSSKFFDIALYLEKFGGSNQITCDHPRNCPSTPKNTGVSSYPRCPCHKVLLDPVLSSSIALKEDFIWNRHDGFQVGFHLLCLFGKCRVRFSAGARCMLRGNPFTIALLSADRGGVGG